MRTNALQCAKMHLNAVRKKLHRFTEETTPHPNDSRGAKGCVKEGYEGLDSGIVAGGMESHAVRAWDEVPVARANKSVAQGP